MSYSRWTPGCCCGDNKECDCERLCSWRKMEGTYDLRPDENNTFIISSPSEFNYVRNSRGEITGLLATATLDWTSGVYGEINDPNVKGYRTSKCPDIMNRSAGLWDYGNPSLETLEIKKWRQFINNGIRYIYNSDNSISYYRSAKDPWINPFNFVAGNTSLYGQLQNYNTSAQPYPIKVEFTGIVANCIAYNFTPVATNILESKTSDDIDFKKLHLGYSANCNINLLSKVMGAGVSGEIYNMETSIREEDILDPGAWRYYARTSAVKILNFVQEIIESSGYIDTQWAYIRTYKCKYATKTKRKWNRNGSCKVIECREPRAMTIRHPEDYGDIGEISLLGPDIRYYYRYSTAMPEVPASYPFGYNGNSIVGAWRYQTNEEEEPMIEDADHVEVRSAYCNSSNCLYYTPPDYIEPLYISGVDANEIINLLEHNRKL